MTNTDGKTQWELLRYGDAEQGLALLRQSYDHNFRPSTIMELSIGYLWRAEYMAAWEHLERAIQIHPFTIDSFFEMKGVAKWCLDETDAAVQCWRSGLNVQFADAAGGIGCPLLLWTTSVLSPSHQSRREAILTLEKKVNDLRVRNWPGALAKFVLGMIDEKDLEARSLERISRVTPPASQWKIAFYKYVLQLERGNLTREAFGELMQDLADTSTPEWNEEKNFLRLIWSAEFFIARHEASASAKRIEAIPEGCKVNVHPQKVSRISLP